MAKRRRSRSKQKLPKAAETIGFTEADEAFFAAGEQSEVMAAIAEAADAEPPPRPSFWRRLLALGA